MKQPVPFDLAEVVLPCADLAAALAWFVGEMGFRIETIFPAEEPHTASLSGHGLRLRLTPGHGDPGLIRLTCARPPAEDQRVLTAPNGTRIEFVAADPPIVMPPFQPQLIVTSATAGPAPGPGRAGMIYRDLIPGRLGGRYIASHISIPQGGPVADWTHFHKIRFQMIFCRRGWVRLVYEDQGEPFLLAAGDCVLQPPRIRHRVLEASEGLEVVEIGCPALHETLADHDMVLPTGRCLPDRDFDGQVFLRHIAADTPWTVIAARGFEAQVSDMHRATKGFADVRVLRPAGGASLAEAGHDRELLFGFLLEGAATLDCGGAHALAPADAFAIPPGTAWALSACSPDLRLLEIRAG
jgi:quercetin dioxygenase-like cupin family protein